MSDFEKFRSALLSAWDERFDPPGRLDVILLSDSEQLSEFAEVPVAAYMSLLPTGWLVVIAGKYPLESPAQVQLHELAHYFSRYRLLRQPRWLSEGLATYLQTIEIDDSASEAMIGRPHLRSFHYVRQHGLLSLADLWNGAASESRQELYASAWLWVHFLINEQGARFDDFLKRLESAEEPDSAWNAAFDGVASETLEQGARSYAQREQLAVRRVGVPHVPPELTQTRLDDAEIHVTRARLYLTARRPIPADRRRELVLNELAQALRHNPQNASARVLEAELITGLGNRAIVASELARSKPEEPGAWSLFARSLRSEEKVFPDLERMLETGAQVAPDDHSVLNELAAYYASHGAPRRGLEAVARAVRLAPWNVRILETYAAILAGVGNCGEAVATQKRAIRLLDEHIPEDVRRRYENRLGTLCGPLPDPGGVGKPQGRAISPK